MTHNRRVLLLLVVVPVLALLAAAQSKKPARAGANSTTDCAYTFSSGSGANATQYCVTANGNIAQFSRPAGVEYINNGFISEGYGVCDYYAGTSYWDYAGDGDNGWGTANVISSTPTSVKISRTTTDGTFTLTQTITRVAASKKGPGAATVTMVLRNNSGNGTLVYLLRYANVDMTPDPTQNHFDYTLDTASGLNPSAYGLASVNNTFTYGWDSGVLGTPHGPSPCDYSATVPVTPFVGDGSIMQVWSDQNLHTGKSMTVTMTYKPI